MNTSRSLPGFHGRSVRWLESTAYTLLLVWAFCWGTFAVLSAAGEGLAAIPYAGLFLAALAGTVLVVRRSALAGALLLLALGVFSLFFFSSSSSRVLLAAPALLLGLLFLILSRARRGDA